MGRGWCFTFIALVCIAAMPMLLVELKYGPEWREERRCKAEKKKAEEEEKRRTREPDEVHEADGIGSNEPSTAEKEADGVGRNGLSDVENVWKADKRR